MTMQNSADSDPKPYSPRTRCQGPTPDEVTPDQGVRSILAACTMKPRGITAPGVELLN